MKPICDLNSQKQSSKTKSWESSEDMENTPVILRERIKHGGSLTIYEFVNQI